MNRRISTRLLLLGVTACLLGGTAVTAAADTSNQDSRKKHVICVINQDSNVSPQHGVCVTLDDALVPVP